MPSGRATVVIFSDTLTPRLNALAFGATDRAENAMEEVLPEVVQYAQDNAPWTDRTGDARSGLDGAVDEDNGFLNLELFHAVDYGIWLETIQSGRFATIMPTLEYYADEIMSRAGAVFLGEGLGVRL